MSNTDLTNFDLNLITGALGSYHCVSEENSVMSGLDLIADTEPGMQSSNDDLLHVTDSLPQNSYSQSGNGLMTGNMNSKDVGISLKNNSEDTKDLLPCNRSLHDVKPAWT